MRKPYYLWGMKWSKIIPYLILGVCVCITLYQQREGAGVGSGEIPDYAIEVLEEIRQTGKAPKGYVGGRTFQNREKRLPKKDASGKKIKYREWDVHRKVKGKNRGAERLVTGSDGSAYFTSDHYDSFTKME